MDVSLYDRQRSVPLPIPKLRSFAGAAAARCLAHRGAASAPLTGLAEVEISLVSDRVIAQVHRRFLDVPGATDVITFAHGEIVISATTAQRQAWEHGESVEREVARYIVHGLLHLNGHEDAGAEEAEAMWQAQETILCAIWPAAKT